MAADVGDNEMVVPQVRDYKTPFKVRVKKAVKEDDCGGFVVVEVEIK